MSDAGFVVKQTCMSCKNAIGSSLGWFKCSLMDYDHEKHDGPMKAGVPPDGWCPKYEREDGSPGYFPEFRE